MIKYQVLEETNTMLGSYIFVVVDILIVTSYNNSRDLNFECICWKNQMMHTKS